MHCSSVTVNLLGGSKGGAVVRALPPPPMWPKCVVLLDVLRSVTFLTVTPNSYARR